MGLDTLERGQYECAKCKDFQAFWGGAGVSEILGAGFGALRAGSVWGGKVMGGQNARIFKHSGAELGCRSFWGAGFGALRAGSVWVGKMQGFSNILWRSWGARVYWGAGLGALRAGFGALRAGSVWVREMQGFSNILGRSWGVGVFGGQGLERLGQCQYGWAKCKDFQAFLGGAGVSEFLGGRVWSA